MEGKISLRTNGNRCNNNRNMNMIGGLEMD